MLEKKLNLCAKPIFKKKSFKLTKGCVFSVTKKLLKQVDGCPMAGPISVVFSDVFICKMELDVIVPAKPIFYKRYVDVTCVLIASAKSRSARGVSHHPVYMSSCLTISHTYLPCLPSGKTLF